jgi:uncharacterized protein with HEPN domain
MRDKLIYDYFGVDLSLVWDVVASELPGARNRIDTLKMRRLQIAERYATTIERLYTARA